MGFLWRIYQKQANWITNRRPAYKPVRFTIGSQHNIYVCEWEWVWMLDGSGCGWVQNIKSQDVFTLCGFTKSCFGMLFRAECDHWHNTQNMVSRTDTIINVPRPSRTCEEGLVFWATFLVTWGGADLEFEITNQIAEALIIAWRKRLYFETNRK